MMFRTDWDMFETVLTPLSHENRFLIAKFFDKISDFDVFKAFISIFLYYNLYQGKLKVIMRPQCGLNFFIRPLVFPLVDFEIEG